MRQALFKNTVIIPKQTSRDKQSPNCTVKNLPRTVGSVDYLRFRMWRIQNTKKKHESRNMEAKAIRINLLSLGEELDFNEALKLECRTVVRI